MVTEREADRVRSRRSVRRGPGVLREALVIAWEADRRGTVIAALLQLVTVVGALGLVAASKLALDSLFSEGGGVNATLVVGMVVLAASAALTSLAGVLQAQHQRVVGERVGQRVWYALLRSCSGVDLSTWDSTEFMARLDRVRSNALSRPVAVMTAAFTVVGAALTLFTLLIALLAIHPLLLPVLLIGGLPTVGLSRAASKSEFRFAAQTNSVLRSRSYFRYLLASRPFAAEIRAFQAGEHLRALHEADSAVYLEELRRQARRRQVLGLATAGVSAVSLGITLILIVLLVRSNRISLAEAGAAAIAARLLAGQLGAVFSGLGTLMEAGPFLSDMRGFLASETPAATRSAPLPLARDIRLRDVRFTYPGARRAALEGVDIVLPRGGVVALVGENGSGKTTLAKVVAGLYTPDGGALEWDGRAVAASALRASVAVLFQDFVRYQMSAAENIAIADTSIASDGDRIRRAAAGADIDLTLSRLPDGYDTALGVELREGVDLSGGQWQRVALARALYRDSPLVILDEPTAAMDPRAEHDLFSDVRRMLSGRTALLISHRYSSVRLADYTYVLDQGRVVEEGTHEELLHAGGRYAELYRLQAAAFATDS